MSVNRRVSEFQSKRPAPERSGASIAVVVAVLELAGSEHPQLIDFLLKALLHSPARFATNELASAVGVSPDEIGGAIYKACRDLAQLERKRGAWKDPEEIVDEPNVLALRYACQARADRVVGTARRRRLEIIERRLRTAHELARSRAWIEAFIGCEAQ